MPDTHFKRARSDTQRERRREAILATAVDMLREMPVAAISLNELSRRVGLAKSNVLRYFESREAILLHLQETASTEWLDALAADLAASVLPGGTPAERREKVAAVIAASLVTRPMLCELVSTAAAVLERNISPETAAHYKRTASARAATLAGLVQDRIPELTDRDAGRFAGTVALAVGSLWAYANPPAAVLAAYQAHPELAASRRDFGDSLRELLAIVLAGLLARAE